MALGGRKQPKHVEAEDKSIEISAQMQGTLSFKDPVSLKINGEFQGALDTKGTLTIGSSGRVEANIEGDNIVIAGKVNGDIIANKMLVLMPTAVLNGNIRTPKLNIVEGALFEGQCQMRTNATTTKEAPKRVEESSADFIDMAEVASYLEIDLKEIEALAESGKIPAKKEGSRWKFVRTEIDAWLVANKVNTDN